jgi:hypothetical protein
MSSTYIYQKSLDAREHIYGQTGTANALWDLIISYDKNGDNKYALEFFDEAVAYRLEALKLFEQSVKKDPTMQKYDSYFRNKVKI